LVGDSRLYQAVSTHSTDRSMKGHTHTHTHTGWG